MHAETLFTGFAGPGGGVGCGRSLAPCQREDIRRECRHGREVVAAFPDAGERGAAGEGRAPAAPSGQPARVAAGVDRRKPDPTLRAILAELAAAGVKVSYGALWAFFAREGITFKKEPVRQRTGPPRPRPPTRAVEEIPGPA